MEFPHNPEQSLRVSTLAPAAIGVLTIAAVQPLAMIATLVVPPHFSEAPWRLRLFGYILGALPQLSISLVVIAAIGLFSEHFRAVRYAAIAAILVAIVEAPILVLYDLDVVQVQHLVSYEQLRLYQVIALQATVIAAFLIPFLIWFGRRGFLAGRKRNLMTLEEHKVITDEPVPGPLDPRVTN